MNQEILDILTAHPDLYKVATTFSGEKLETIAQKRGFKPEDFIGMIDVSILGNGAEGVYFTTSHLYWAVDAATIDERKKLRGSLPYRELLHTSTEVTTGPLSNTLRIKKVNGVRTWSEIKIKFAGGVHYSDPLLELVKAIIEHAKTLPEKDAETLSPDDEYEAQALEAFLGNTNPKALAFYRGAFGRYHSESNPTYAWAWSWAAALFGPLYLVLYKLYNYAAGFALASLVIGYFFPLLGVLAWLSIGTVGPYLYFTKFIKDKAIAESESSEQATRIERIAELGKPNPVVAKVGGTFGIIIGALIIVTALWFFIGLPF